ncbi:MAG: tetratricopeptide repeat protein [Saprospiraceae bacterium]
MAKRRKHRKLSTTPHTTKKTIAAAKRTKVKEPFSLKWKLLIAAMLAVVAMSIYGPSYDYDYVYDDDAVVKENTYVQQGLAGLKKIWTTSYFEGYSEKIKARAYRPVPLTTLAIENQFWGLNPSVSHISNLLTYGATAFFLFLFLSGLLRNYHPALPIFITLLFVFHPIHIEVVANVKSRDTMLGFLGFILASWLLLKHLDYGKKWPLVLSLLFYFAGLFSKEEVITTMAIIPLMLYFFRDYKLGKIFVYTLPFVAAVIIYLGIRSNILGGINEGVRLTKLDNSLLGANGFSERSASNILVLGQYLFKSVFPHPLISDYSYMTLPLVNWDDWRVWLSLLANIGLLWVGLRGLAKRKIYGFGALYYFIAVSIFTSIIVTNVSAYNDRFLYSPSLGICFLTSWLLLKLVKETPKEYREKPLAGFFRTNFLAVAATVLLCGAGLVKISMHLPVWTDRFALFEHDAILAPNNARMRKNHGGSLARKAVEVQTTNPQKAREYAEKAIAELQTALDIYDNIPTGHIHMGNMYIILGDYQNAENSLKKSLDFAPGNYFALSSLANVYYREGKYQEGLNTISSIDRRFLKPNDYYLFSLIYSKLGDAQKASEYRALSGR